jgi:hypothetical protein
MGYRLPAAFGDVSVVENSTSLLKGKTFETAKETNRGTFRNSC